MMPACSKTKTRPRGGVAAGQRRARGPRTHTTGHSGRRRSARDAVPFVLPRTRPGEREGSSPPRLGGTRHAARVTFPRAEIMFKRLFGAEKSGGGSAPSAGSTGGGGGGKTTPLGAVEQLKDVRHPQIQPARVSFFFPRTSPGTRAVCRCPTKGSRTFAKRRVFLRSRRFFHRSARSGRLVRGLSFVCLPATRH